MEKRKIKIMSFIKKPSVFVSVIIILVIIVSYILINNNNNKDIEVITVSKQDIVQTVSVSGKTKPTSSVDLGFEKSGKVSAIFANVGDNVEIGQTLVRLDSSDLYANLSEAEANLSAEKAKLSEMKKGTRAEELKIAEDSYLDSKKSLSDKIQDAYTKSDDAIRNNIDQLFENPRLYTAKIIIPISNFQLENDINIERYKIEEILNDWILNIDSITVEKTFLVLEKVQSFLDKIAQAVNPLKTDSNIPLATINSYKTAVSNARISVNLALSNLTSARTVFNSAKANYDFKLAGNTVEAIQVQEARVLQTEASVVNIKAQIYKNTISAPISGLIIKQDAKVGEIVSPGIKLISIISANNLEVEAYVPEINVGKVSIGNSVSMTLDAFSGETFNGKLVYIDPAETLIDNVPNFKLKIVFDKADLRIKSGLSVNIDIEVGKKENVLALPQYTIISDSGKYFVEKTDGKDFSDKVKTEIQIGVRGDNGFTEIISGIFEGEKVLFSGQKK